LALIATNLSHLVCRFRTRKAGPPSI